MDKKSCTKKVMAIAFAVAGLTFVGNYAQASDYENPSGIMKTINSSTKYKSGYKYKKVAPKRFYVNKSFSKNNSSAGGEITGFAVPTKPTLSEIKDYIGTNHHYEISTTKDENHTNPVKIGDTIYYYSPSIGDTTILRVANTGAFVEGDSGDYLFTDGVNFWKYDSTKLKDSVFNYASGTSEDYNFQYNDGTNVAYYKTNIDTSKMNISNKIEWTKVNSSSDTEYNVDDSVLKSANGVVSFKLPHNGSKENQYYKWNYTNNSEAVPNDYGASYTEGYYFQTSGSNDHGGAMIIVDEPTISSITTDFINNFSQSGTGSENIEYGGAIWNNSTINSITANFITNKAQYGGAIANDQYSSNIISLEGDFIGNVAFEDGGAIYNNYSATIGSITGDFTGNSAENYGGAIFNYSTISSITGDFIGNSAENYGGAIYNNDSAVIESITGDFIGNSGNEGGAIYNNYSTISSITGDFISNSAYNGGAISNDEDTAVITTITGDFIGNSAENIGGAINNYGYEGQVTISSINGNFISNSAGRTGGAIHNNDLATIESITGNFTNNSVVGEDVKGGAIYNDGEITLSGNTFTGNTVNSKPNSIYNGYGTINIADGAIVNVHDGYDGLSNAQLNIGTGSIFNLSVDNGTIQTDNLGNVTNNGTINWDLDINLTGGTSDNITVTDGSISGTNSIIIHAIKLMTDKEGETNIAFASGSPIGSYILSSTINDNIFSPGGYEYTVSYAGGILTFNGSAPTPKLADVVQDTSEGPTAIKEYTIPDGGETVVADSGLGTLVGSKLTITGDSKKILGNGKAGMTLGAGTQEQTLIVNNVSEWSGHSGNSITLGSNANLEITGSSIASIAGTAKSMKFTGSNTIGSNISSATVSNKGALALGTNALTANGTFTNGDSDTTTSSITAGTVTVKGAGSVNYGTITGNVVVDGGDLTNNNTITGNVTT